MNNLENAVATGYNDDLLGTDDKAKVKVKPDFTGFTSTLSSTEAALARRLGEDVPPIPNFLRRPGYGASKVYEKEAVVKFRTDGDKAKIDLAGADEAAGRIVKAIGVMLDVEGVAIGGTATNEMKVAITKALTKAQHYDAETGELRQIVITA